MRASVENQRVSLERLRKTQVTGRIVLDIAPNSRTVDMVPDIPLENGDRFVVPSIPATVNVFGTVYNQSSFLYKEDANIRGYLQEAGGPTRFADESHIFVIRADGSVCSRTKHPHFEAQLLYPGDTLIVPTNADEDVEGANVRRLVAGHQRLWNRCSRDQCVEVVLPPRGARLLEGHSKFQLD